MKLQVGLAAALLVAQPVMAAKCPYGQIYRVRLMECVSWNSALARAYVGRPVHITLRKLIIDTPPVAPPRPTDPKDSDTVKILKAGAIPVREKEWK